MIQTTATKVYGVATDYTYNESHKRDRIVVWSGPFASNWEAEGISLPKGDGYMLSLGNGRKARVTCPTPRNDANYREIDRRISEALSSLA